MPELPATRTPAGPAELRAALLAAEPSLSTHQQALLLAHISNETRNGKSIFQHNVGNISVNPKTTSLSFWRPPWFTPPGPDTSDRNRFLHGEMLANRAPSAFAAYPSLAAGVGAYMSAMRGRYSPMLRASSPAEFVREWRDTGYTPGLDVVATTPGFARAYQQFGGFGATAGETSPSSAGGPVLVGAIVLGALWAMKRKTG